MPILELSKILVELWTVSLVLIFFLVGFRAGFFAFFLAMSLRG